MIVEEAAEILEPQLIAIIFPSVEHLILIGDHKQLKPTVTSKLVKEHHLNISLFERLINCGLPYATLGSQCRMRDELADLVCTMKIYGEYRTNEKVNWKAKKSSVLQNATFHPAALCHHISVRQVRKGAGENLVSSQPVF